MKKLITITMLLLMIVACKKENSSNNIIEQAQNDTFLTAKIDGVKFYSDNPNYSKFDNLINLYGESKDKTEKILFQIVYDNGPSTYNMGKATNKKGNMIYTHNKVPWIVSKHRGEGSITLTEEGGYLIGEFSFAAVDNENKKQITEGEFRVLKK